MNEKQKKEEKIKPKYGMCSNTWFMIRNAWKVRKSVLVFCIMEALLGIISNLIGLYIGPVVLNTIETKSSIAIMLQIILVMVGAMMAAAAATQYVNGNKMYGKIEVRKYLTTNQIRKFCTTAYPNLWNQKFLKMDSMQVVYWGTTIRLQRKYGKHSRCC